MTDPVETLEEILERLAPSHPDAPRSLADLIAMQARVARDAQLVRQLLGIEPIPDAVGMVSDHVQTLIGVLTSGHAMTDAERRYVDTILAASWGYLMSVRQQADDAAHQASLEAYEWSDPDVQARAHVHETRATPVESERYPGAFVHECECGALGISSAASGGVAIWGRDAIAAVDRLARSTK